MASFGKVTQVGFSGTPEPHLTAAAALRFYQNMVTDLLGDQGPAAARWVAAVIRTATAGTDLTATRTFGPFKVELEWMTGGNQVAILMASIHVSE